MAEVIEADERLDAAEPLSAEEHALALRHPGVPLTLAEVAALRGLGLEILRSRNTALDTQRKAAIRMTDPPDWTLNRAPSGQVTGYLGDAGCTRLRDSFGVAIVRVYDKEKILAADGSAFMWVMYGDGRSTITGQVVVYVEGARISNDKFFTNQKLGELALDLKVRKSARANLNGCIVRELAGLKNLDVARIVEAWEGTGKKIEDCPKGHGFGSQDERHGANAREGDPDVPPPTCPHCAPVNGAPVALKYRPASGTRAAFYGCPNYTTHPAKKIIVDAAEWIAKSAKGAAAENARLDKEIAEREPGSDG